MAPNDLRSHVEWREFAPIRIHIADGAVYDLDGREYANVHVTTLLIGLDEDGAGLPSRTLYIDIRHVTQVEILAPRKIEE